MHSTPTDPAAPNFHPVSTLHASDNDDSFFGPLEPKDTEWACPSGFAVETQVYYHMLDDEDKSFLIFQVIHSSLG